MLESIAGNVKYDSDGTPVGLYGPSDTEFKSPYSSPDYSYAENLKKHIENMLFKESKGGMSPTEYQFFEKQKSFLYALQESYQKHNIT